MKVKTRTKKPLRKARGGLLTKKRFCRFCADKSRHIDYKDTRLLESFIKDRGKIVSTRSSGNCAKHQRRIAEAIKKARFLSMVPYVRY